MTSTTFATVPTAPCAPRLRITKRGRSVLALFASVPLILGASVFVLNGGAATAGSDASGVELEYVTVGSGESLWQLAGELAPTADPREVIDQVVRLNQLDSSDVFAGQELAIPAAYSQR